MHHRVQQMIIDSIEGKPIVLSTDEMGSISEMIDNHLDIENEMVGLVHQSPL